MLRAVVVIFFMCISQSLMSGRSSDYEAPHTTLSTVRTIFFFAVTSDSSNKVLEVLTSTSRMGIALFLMSLMLARLQLDVQLKIGK